MLRRLSPLIHQNHDYSHNPNGTAGVWKGPESERNKELAGGPDHAFSLEYANMRLTPRGVKLNISPRNCYFRLMELPALYPGLSFLSRPMQALTGLIIKLRSRTTVRGKN